MLEVNCPRQQWCFFPNCRPHSIRRNGQYTCEEPGAVVVRRTKRRGRENGGGISDELGGN